MANRLESCLRTRKLMLGGITVKLQDVLNKSSKKEKEMSIDTHYAIKNLAIVLWSNRTRMTFSELADELGLDSAWHAGKAVTNAWRFFEKRGDSRACAVISRSFHRKGSMASKDALKSLQTRLCDVLFELDYLVQGLVSHLEVAQRRASGESRDVEDPFEMSDEEHSAYVRATLSEIAEDLQAIASNPDA